VVFAGFETLVYLIIGIKECDLVGETGSLDDDIIASMVKNVELVGSGVMVGGCWKQSCQR
jgi:hypothetical protein